MRKKSVHAPRPKYHDKAEVILKAIKRLVYQQRERGLPDFGFTMAQIAEEAGYARSARFMETLYSMSDDGMLEMQEWKSGNQHIPNRVWFRIAATHKQKSFVS